LQTEQLDLLQIHAVNSDQELAQILSNNGSLRAALEAQRNGETRFIGITGHARPQVLAAALDQFSFDSVLMPLGVADEMVSDFSSVVVPKARAQGIAIVGMKVFGQGQYFPKLRPQMCLRYTLSLPISLGIVGMSRLAHLDTDLQAIEDFAPLNDREMRAARGIAAGFADIKTLWWKRT
jgi:predicted aldo/keto reductase-like oxidoreductase